MNETEKKYRTIQIGSQTWMAENLNYEYNYGSAQSVCYQNDPDNCVKYGRLYTWSAAIDSAARFSMSGQGCGHFVLKCEYKNTSQFQGVCPDGWHLPSSSEWNTLIRIVGLVDSKYEKAGFFLKSNESWSELEEGSNLTGFSVLPGGNGMRKNGLWSFSEIANEANFWSSSENQGIYGYAYSFDASWGVREGKFEEYEAKSIRCIKN